MSCVPLGDLIDALKRLVGTIVEQQISGIIIECSGLAECAPVAQTFFLDPYVQANLQLDAVICVCDCHRLRHLLAEGPSLRIHAP